MNNYKMYILCFLFSCNINSNKEKKVETGQRRQRIDLMDSLIINDSSKSASIEKILFYEKKDLRGIWAVDTVDNATIVFEKDSLYYVEHLGEHYFYTIEKDTLLIDLNGYVSKVKIELLRNDTLVMNNFGRIDTLLRRI